MNRRMSRLGLTALALVAGGTSLVAQQATGGTVSTLVKALTASPPFLQQAGEAP